MLVAVGVIAALIAVVVVFVMVVYRSAEVAPLAPVCAVFVTYRPVGVLFIPNPRVVEYDVELPSHITTQCPTAVVLTGTLGSTIPVLANEVDVVDAADVSALALPVCNFAPVIV